jgi:hypothetical protein
MNKINTKIKKTHNNTNNNTNNKIITNKNRFANITPPVTIDRINKKFLADYKNSHLSNKSYQFNQSL